jgi:hypothetical protein
MDVPSGLLLAVGLALTVAARWTGHPHPVSGAVAALTTAVTAAFTAALDAFNPGTRHPVEESAERAWQTVLLAAAVLASSLYLTGQLARRLSRRRHRPTGDRTEDRC